jgi:cellulose synthase/poly-beta-1,6-N-acetylglucosamine synthase-like glycosyltransferase
MGQIGNPKMLSPLGLYSAPAGKDLDLGRAYVLSTSWNYNFKMGFEMNYPFISIVIPVKNGGSLLVNCLESLSRLDYPRDKYEVIIVDGGSTDGSREVAKKFGSIVVDNKKGTVSPGRNRGFEASRGDFIAFSDADCVMEQDWLKNALKYFEDSKIGGVGGVEFNPPDGKEFSRAVEYIFRSTASFTKTMHTDNFHGCRETKHIPGCNAFYRRKVLEKIMPSNETLLTADDVELNRQVRRAGYKLLQVSDVRLWHYRRHTMKNLWRQMYRYAVGRLQVGKFDFHLLNFAHIFTGLFIPIILAVLAIGFILSKTFFWAVIAIFIAGLIAAGIMGMLKTKLASAGFYVPLVLVISCFAWSLGFLRELFFPMRKLEGK